ncbi:MAG TPA: glutamate racemase [Terriglobales bacterium]|nr:glutamate racemase [Terriglobales bacterium]
MTGIARRTAIGVFDSGVGGLTVLKALLEVVPEADYLYFGDTARLPYGSKSVETVSKYAAQAVRYLEHHHAQVMVIACNTATALALDAISQAVRVPVIGVVEPGAEQAALESRNRKAVVLGTEATISSHAYLKALATRGIEAREKACPLLVPLVEEGWIEHPVSEQVSRIYLSEAFSAGYESADVLLLGCTHYPLLKPLLRRVVPSHVAIIDSAQSSAQAVAKVLAKVAPADSALRERRHAPRLRFFATDSAEKFRCLGTRFLGHPIEDVVHVDLRE